MSFRLGLVVALGVVAGCGGKPEAKAPPAPVETASPVTVDEPPDLSPVARPAELVAVAHVARPRAFVETLAKWSNLPLRLEDMMPEDARAFAGAVLWEAPIDAVVALDAFGDGKVPPPLLVASIGLKSLEAGLSAADKLQLQTRRVAPGVYRVGDFGSTSCALAASVGPAPARLVCGRGSKDLDVLLPYVTRGLPSEPQSGADFELVATAKPIQDRYGQDVNALRLLAGLAIREVALDVPRFDRALSDAIYAGVDETINLFSDLDQIRLEARLDSARSVLTASAEIRVKGEASWTAGTMSATKAVLVPSNLPRIPPGATMASYTAPLPVERYAAMTRILGDLGEGFLEHEKLPEATRKRARRVFDSVFSQMSERFQFVVTASQQDAVGYLHADTTVTRVSEPSARLLAVHNDAFALFNDPALKRWAKQKVKLDDKAWPKATKKPLKLAGFKVPATAFELTFDMKALADIDESFAKTLERVVTTVDAKQLARLVIVVQPDGDYTYVIWGDDTKEMTRVMAEHKKSEPGAFFAKPARADKVVVAGYTTLAFIGRYLERAAKAPEVGKAVVGTPNRGETPITFASSVSPGSARIDFELPAAALGDASAAAVRSAGSLKDAFDKR